MEPQTTKTKDVRVKCPFCDRMTWPYKNQDGALALATHGNKYDPTHFICEGSGKLIDTSAR